MDTTTNNVITASSLQPVQALTLPPTPTDTTDYSQYIAPTLTSLAGDSKTLDTQLNTAQRSQADAAQKQLDIMGLLTGKTADTQAAQEAAGVTTETTNLNKYAEQLANLNAQASALNREAQAVPLQVQQESQGRGRTEAGIAPIQTARLRENAIKALSIGQQADIAAAAATGSQLRLNAAKEKAQQVVDLKYKPLEDQLAILKQQYELNKDLLSSIDKKRTESLNAAIKKEETLLAERKANEKAISGLVVNASSQGAPQDIVSRASKAKTEAEAAQILGIYAGDYWGTQLKIAEYNKINAEAQKVIDEGKATTSGKVSPEEQAKYLIDTVSQASALADNSGRSGLRRSAEALLVGSTDYTALETKVRTLKTNLLTLATDPNIKKFFGPQMSNNDVSQMLAAASTLDTEKQSPQELKDELARVETIFQKFAPGYTSQYVSSGDEKVDAWYKKTSQGVTASIPFNGGYTDNQAK